MNIIMQEVKNCRDMRLSMRFFKDMAPTGQQKKGIEKLVDRGINRGYKEELVYMGLNRALCKNYTRSRYQGCEPQDERLYIEDEELRAIMDGREPILWA